jgi:hypothetical protein
LVIQHFLGIDSATNSADSIQGTCTGNLLQLTTDAAVASGGAAYSIIPTLSNIQTVSVNDQNTGAGTLTDTVSLVNSTGVTNVTNKLSANSVTFSNIQSLSTVTVSGSTCEVFTYLGRIGRLEFCRFNPSGEGCFSGLSIPTLEYPGTCAW